MKRKILLILALLSALFILSACNNNDEPTYYMVSFDSNGAEGYQDRAIERGGLIVEPQVPTRTGYYFLGWYNGDTPWNFETDRVNSSLILKAKWSRITYSVRFNSNEGSPVPEQTVEAGNFATRPIDPTRENYRFIGWFNGNDEWYFNVDRVTDYITLVARWEAYPTYTVTFDSNGGTNILSQYIIEGHKATEPALPTKENSRFLGWYVGDALWSFNTNTINSNVTLTARWESIPTYTVTFNSSGGSDVPAQHIAEGEKAIKPAVPDRAQFSKFLGWYLGDTEFDFDTVITENITLVAKWKNIYKVIFDVDGSQDYVYVDEGEPIQKRPEPTKENNRFIGWYYNDRKWDFNNDIPTSDMTLTAGWEHTPTYTVTFNSDGGTPVREQFVGYPTYYLPEPGNPTKPGYRFDGWFYGTEKWDFNADRVSSNITLTAKWVKTFIIEFDSSGGTLVNPIMVDKDTKATKPKDPTKSGYAFGGWLLEDGTEWNFDTAVTKNITLTAKWLFVVTFDSDGGSVIPSIAVDADELITKPQNPTKQPNSTKQYMFDGWYIAGTSIKWNFEEMRVTQSITLRAKWRIVLPPQELE